MGDIRTGTNGKVTDRDILAEKAEISHEEAMHIGALTEEELIMEKKLVRKIDLLIMPLIVLVYLMNYIDRYGRQILILNSSDSCD